MLQERMNAVISLTRRVFELSVVAIGTGTGKFWGGGSRGVCKNLWFFWHGPH